jgi:hypothetical protein
LDEFSLAPTHRAKELAVFAWHTSNRQKLLDHLELTVAGITTCQKGTKFDYIYYLDEGLPLACRAMRTSGTTMEMRAVLTAQMEAVKFSYRDWFRPGREFFHSIFSDAEIGLKREWGELLEEFRQEPEMRQMLYDSLTQSGLLHSLP